MNGDYIWRREEHVLGADGRMPFLYVLQVATQQMYFIHSLILWGLLVRNPHTLSHETRSEDPGIRLKKHIPKVTELCFRGPTTIPHKNRCLHAETQASSMPYVFTQTSYYASYKIRGGKSAVRFEPRARGRARHACQRVVDHQTKQSVYDAARSRCVPRRHYFHKHIP